VSSGLKISGLMIFLNFKKKWFMELNRITFDPNVMGGKPCIRGMRVTVGTIVGLIASGKSFDDVVAFYPYLETQDISEALAYAAWRADEIEVPFQAA